MKHFPPANAVRHISICERGEHEPVVQNGLAITPAKMLELQNMGFSISSQNARMLDDVRPDDMRHMNVPMEYRRNFDIADAFQSHMEFNKKVHKAIDEFKASNEPSQKAE